MLDEHLIFFIDFLGFSEATRNETPQKLGGLIALLRNLALLRSEFALTEQTLENGSSFEIRPAVSTFSDHIVVSYPIESMRKVDGNDILGTTLMMAQTLIGTLAAEALQLELLIRGGVTVGHLYHSGGVVFGEAMNEAYRLESSVSIYPRITVSRKVYSKIQTFPPSLLVLADSDGITHFNYFTSMLLSAGLPGDVKQKRQAWLTKARQTVADNVGHFEQREEWNKLAKWVWFGKHLEQARVNINNALFENRLPQL